MRMIARLVALGSVVGGAACGHAPAGDPGAPNREVVLSFDDNRPSAQLSFANLTYESLIRYELPPGKHTPLRLRALVATAGTLQVTLYANSLLESPADPIHTLTWNLTDSDVSSGKDGLWLVSDLHALGPMEGVIWVGLRKVGGEPTVWTSTAVSGQTFLRDRSPGNGMGILPVKRTPLVRLEVSP